MARALDEPDAVYGLVAHSAEVAPDRSSVVFRLRPEAKFADGSALTADDVVFTLNTLKEKGHPIYRVQLRDVVKAEAHRSADRALHLHRKPDTRPAAGGGSDLPVLPKAYYATREFDQTTLDPPLGSGPYRLARLQARNLRQLPAPRGLLGQGPQRQPRPLQFRRAALRVLSRPHRRARKPESRRLRPARGIHRARLGHRLRYSRSQGGSARPLDAAGRAPGRRPRLLSQHAPTKVLRRARAQGAGLRLRLRMDQQEHLLRALLRAPRASSRTPT